MPIDYYAFELFTRSAEAIAKSSFNFVAGGVASVGLWVLRDIALAAPRKPVEQVEPKAEIAGNWRNQPQPAPAEMFSFEVSTPYATKGGAYRCMWRVELPPFCADNASLTAKLKEVGAYMVKHNVSFARDNLTGTGRPLSGGKDGTFIQLSNYLLSVESENIRQGGEPGQWATPVYGKGIVLGPNAKRAMGIPLPHQHNGMKLANYRNMTDPSVSEE